MWTKGEIVDHAYAALGIAPDAFNIAPEQRAQALRTLDAMMALWSAKGIAPGYVLPVSPSTSSLTSDSGLPDTAIEAAYQNLALRIAPFYGKQASQHLMASAKTAYDTLMNAAAEPLATQFDTLPLGAGNKPWNLTQPFFPAPNDALDANGNELTI